MLKCNKINKIFILLSFSFLLNSCGSTVKNNEDNRIELFEIEKMDLCSDNVMEYLNMNDETEICSFFNSNKVYQQDFQPTFLKWKSNGSKVYSVLISKNENMENASTYTANRAQISYIGNLIPGEKYYWKVLGDKENDSSKVSSFTTTSCPLRMISASGAYNIRDFGGWPTKDGKKIPYELVYRGGRLNNNLNNEGIHTFNDELRMKAEIDLRTPNVDDGNQEECFFNKEGVYLKAPLTGYTTIFNKTCDVSNRGFDSRTYTSIKSIFELLADENNYPVYIHCNAGADRTGTIFFLLGGLLGVAYDDLLKDYELTSFSSVGLRLRSSINAKDEFSNTGVFQDDSNNYIAFGAMYDMMMKYYGKTDSMDLSYSVEQYLSLECGIELTTLNKVKDILKK